MSVARKYQGSYNKGPEPMLTVRLAETPVNADLAPLTAEAYPVEPVKKRRGGRRKKSETFETEEA
jgi:hypothetical protein